MDIASVDDLLAPSLLEDTVEVPGLDKSVKVRGLSRAEHFKLMSLNGVEFESYLLSSGMLEPRLTEALAQQWLESVGPSVIEPVSLRILQLSKLTKETQKDATKSVPGES